MGIFSRFKQSIGNGIEFNRVLDEQGIDFRIFPRQFQQELYLALRRACQDDPELLTVHTSVAAKIIASLMSPAARRRLGLFEDPHKWQLIKPTVAFVVP